MQIINLKYNTLTNRLSTENNLHSLTALSIIGAKVRDRLNEDPFCVQIKVVNDITVSRQAAAAGQGS